MEYSQKLSTEDMIVSDVPFEYFLKYNSKQCLFAARDFDLNKSETMLRNVSHINFEWFNFHGIRYFQVDGLNDS